MKAISFTPASTRQWLKLSPDIRKRIDAKLTVYAANGSGVIFIEDARSITVVAVGNRKEIYD
jgi:mRNA interferase RelE/StbE